MIWWSYLGRVHTTGQWRCYVTLIFGTPEYLINCQISKRQKATSGNTVTRSDGVVVILAQFQIGKPVLIVETCRSFIFINFLILEYLHYGRNFHICAKNFEAIFHTKYVLYLCHYNPHLASRF